MKTLKTILFILVLLLVIPISCQNNKKGLENKIAALEDSIAKLSVAHQRQTSVLSEKENDYKNLEQSSWIVYKNDGITFKYPKDYSVDRALYDESCYIRVKPTEDEQISMLSISFTKNPFPNDYDFTEVEAGYQFDALENEMRQYFSDISISSTSKSRIGDYEGFVKTLVINDLGMNIHGESFAACTGKYVLSYYAQGASEADLKLLTDIANTIRFYE